MRDVHQQPSGSLAMNDPVRPALLDLEGYAIAAMVQASLGGAEVMLGTSGRCRFCGTTDPQAFRNIAHTLPEAFGNKWVTSLDECDACNARFGSFDDALAKSLGAVLTLGGTQGKGNKVRQTGRTAGPASIHHSTVEGRRSISMRATGTLFSEHVAFDAETGDLILSIPAGAERFMPSRAYKALVKMAIEILPEEDLPHFSKVNAWLKAPDDDLLPNMVVGLSVSNLGNAPPLLSAALLRRLDDRQNLPSAIFVTTMGSVCLQAALWSDADDGPWPPRMRTRPDLRWTSTIGAAGHDDFVLDYGRPTHLDWGRSALELPIFETVGTRFNSRTNHGALFAKIRPSALAERPR
jgi:hypothetical protein